MIWRPYGLSINQILSDFILSYGYLNNSISVLLYSSNYIYIIYVLVTSEAPLNIALGIKYPRP